MDDPIQVDYVRLDQIPKPKKESNNYYRQLVRNLNKNQALKLTFDNVSALRKGQARMHYASISEFGTGHLCTYSDNLCLHVWLRDVS